MRSALAPVAAHDGERKSFVHVQVGVIQIADRAGLDQRNRDAGRAYRQRNGFERILETKLERDVFARVAVIVDVDLVQGVGVELVVVGSTVIVLQRLVICQQRHIVGASAAAVGRDAFVTSEHIEIGTVDFGAGGDERRLAMARGHGAAGRD